MITSTLQTLLLVTDAGDACTCLEILVNYPDYKLSDIDAAKPVFAAIINELNRQYTRWDQRGGDNAE